MSNESNILSSFRLTYAYVKRRWRLTPGQAALCIFIGVFIAVCFRPFVGYLLLNHTLAFMAIGTAPTLLLFLIIFLSAVGSEKFKDLMQQSVNEPVVEQPSGLLLMKVSKFLLTSRAHGEIVSNALADMWDQQQEALAAGEIWKYRWIGFRDQSRILLALAQEPFSKLIMKILTPFIFR